MALTVADVLSLPVVAAGRPRVRVGGRPLEAAVRWVHVSELTEVAGLLQGGELLLSTGMRLLAPELDVTAYLSSLREAGVVGLVVELGPALPALPERLVDAARAQRFPLVELARPVRFVAVTEAVHGALLHDRYAWLRFSEQVHEAFSALTTRADRDGVQRVLDRASELLGHAVVLEDRSHRAVALAGGRASDVLVDWGARSRRLPSGADLVVGGPEGWSASPVGPPGARWGRLVVPERGSDGERTALVLGRAAEALTVSRLVSGDPSDITERAVSTLLRDLLGADRRDEPALRARARALGLPLPCAVVPLAVLRPPGPPAREEEGAAAVTGRPGAPGGGPAGGGGGGGLEPVVTRVLERLGMAALVAGVRPHTTGVLLAVPGTTGDRTGPVGPRSPVADGDDAVQAAAARAAERVSEALARTPVTREDGAPGGAPLVVAAGAASTLLAVAGEGLLEACEVAVVAAGAPGRLPGAVHRRDRAGVRGLLWGLREDARLQAYAEDQLGPLLRDARRSSADLALLEALLASGGSMTRLAVALDANRPSLYARVRRLGQRLGRDLDDPEVRTSLHVALLALRQQEHLEHWSGR